MIALVFNTELLLLALVLRKPTLYVPAFVAVWTLLVAASALSPARNGLLPVVLVVVPAVLYWVAIAVVLVRFGVFALACAFWGRNDLIDSVPLTWDQRAWYFGQGLAGALIVLSLAVFGFVTATSGGRLFREGFFGDD